LWKPKVRSKTVFKVPAMTLTSKEIRLNDPISRTLQCLDGVLDVSVNYPKGEVFVESDPSIVTGEEIDHALRSVGYRSVSVDNRPISSA